MIDIESLKVHCRAHDDFLFFCEEILGYKEDKDIGYYNFTDTHRELCGILTKMPEAAIFLLPRESLKSQIITIGYSLWRLVRDPSIRILIYSDSATKAQLFLYGIKTHIEGKAPNSKFRHYYPRWETDPHKGGTYNESRITVRARKHDQKEPSIDTSGIDSSKIGNHYDLILYDDTVSDINTTTKDQMDKVHNNYKKSLSLLKRGGEKILVGTRWHYGDSYARIMAENKETGEFLEFVKDAEEIGKDGKLLFEDIGMTREWLDNQRRKQGSYLFSALYRNNPVDDETALFKIEDFGYYVQTPSFHENMYITCTCDPAGEGEDFTAITVVGTDKEKRMYVLDIVNDHLKPNQIVDRIINLNYKWGFDRFAIERNFFKGMLEKELRDAVQEESRNERFKPFSVEEVIASAKQRNFTRVLSLQPFHERGAIYLPNTGDSFNTLSKNYSELGFQMIQFTIDGSKSPHDDLVISLSLHVDIIARGGEPQAEGPPRTSAAWIELQNFEEMSRNNSLPMRYKQNYEMVFNK